MQPTTDNRQVSATESLVTHNYLRWEHMIASTTLIARRLSTAGTGSNIMGFTKEVIRHGNGSKPIVGQTVTGTY